MSSRYHSLIFKSFIFLLSLSFGWYLVKEQYIHSIIHALLPLQIVSELLAGALYTSFLTTPIAIASLIVIAEESNPIVVALLAGTGAAITDLLLVKIFKDKFSKEIRMLEHEPYVRKIEHFLKVNDLQFLAKVLGVIVIASPIPDEVGLLLLGATKLRDREIFLLTYLLNTIGILLILLPFNF